MAPAPSDSGLLALLYGTVLGRTLLRPLISRPVSKAAGRFMDSAISRPLIPRFIRSNGIDMAEYEAETYQSFNAFFTRRIRSEARPMEPDPERLMAPCDGRLSVYAIDEDSVFTVKNSRYDVSALLGGDGRAADFVGGTCLVFRLSVDDYHRYHYLDDGTKEDNHFVPGVLHTVRPIALAHTAVFIQNCREYTFMRTAHFGTVAQVEVGALLVGRISNDQQSGAFTRGQEKGRFLYGGSTVVLLLQKDAAVIDERFWRATARDEETRVKLGEGIGFSQTGGKHA
ncbi:MAG: phosphatidylserine decarboxylase [Clostridia bacterium]|nr:phosphatidylserine decarboxylase [Clostridia bacterium]